MSLASIQYRKMAAFVYVLIFLLAFNLLFNLTFDWYGISIIVRVYLFVFSFYLIYNYSTIDVDRLGDLYRKRFGSKGYLLILLELGIAPIIIIYGITVIFTFIDYLRIDNWPWNPVLKLLNGRYSNGVIYSLFLFLILKTKKGPGLKIAAFFALSILYFILDKTLYTVFTSGIPIAFIKFSKFTALFFFLFFTFLGVRQKLRSLVLSVILSSILLGIIIMSYYGIYRYSPMFSYQHDKSAIVLMRFGFSFPMENLKKVVIEKKSIPLFRELASYSSAIGREVEFSDKDWEELLFSGSMSNANLIAVYILNRDIAISYEKLIDFAEKKLTQPDDRTETVSSYISLTAKTYDGKREALFARMERANNTFRLFCLALLGEARDTGSIPYLLDRLTGMEMNMSDASYESLRKISGLDPAGELGVRRNDPEAVWKFREYYSRNRKGN